MGYIAGNRTDGLHCSDCGNEVGEHSKKCPHCGIVFGDHPLVTFLGKVIKFPFIAVFFLIKLPFKILFYPFRKKKED
jgi:hypothetical protein